MGSPYENADLKYRTVVQSGNSTDQARAVINEYLGPSVLTLDGPASDPTYGFGQQITGQYTSNVDVISSTEFRPHISGTYIINRHGLFRIASSNADLTSTEIDSFIADDQGNGLGTKTIIRENFNNEGEGVSTGAYNFTSVVSLVAGRNYRFAFGNQTSDLTLFEVYPGNVHIYKPPESTDVPFVMGGALRP